MLVGCRPCTRVRLTRKLPEQLLQLIQQPLEPAAAQQSTSLMQALGAGLLRLRCCRLAELQPSLVRHYHWLGGPPCS